MNDTERYLASLLPERDTWVKEMESYASEHHVPIMEPLGIEFLMQMIRMKKPGRILEIGTAIGYSALRMAEAFPEAEIITMERDPERYREAQENLAKYDRSNKIKVLIGDALDLRQEAEKNGPYDLLFIDAAKGQYQKFFEIYSGMLHKDGVIISDNVLFKGFVAGRQADNKKMENIAGKIREYNKWLISHPDYHTTIVPIGDGVAISVKK
ncbi:O-methyltransferase [Thalassobacillus pellis]|uniref:O-methyltransferase n=1 Tax=Thalassobacillus pellis TaxID=748008 RepID=UPI0019618E55|nr:O-methyltransferase [Thalassobacillus pellis]MBM7554674.1 putative O-methyltransferase YrrM [Thalassobacillus pellis]